MVAVIRDTADGARDLIRDWPLIANTEHALGRTGPARLVRYYQACLDRPGSRDTWINAMLQVHRKRTLESEHRRFMAIHQGLGDNGIGA